MKWFLVIGLLAVLLFSGCVDSDTQQKIQDAKLDYYCETDADCAIKSAGCAMCSARTLKACVNKNSPESECIISIPPGVATCTAFEADHESCECVNNSCDNQFNSSLKKLGNLVANCDWRLSDLESGMLTQPDFGAYYDGEKCVEQGTGHSVANFPFETIEECQIYCE